MHVSGRLCEALARPTPWGMGWEVTSTAMCSSLLGLFAMMFNWKTAGRTGGYNFFADPALIDSMTKRLFWSRSSVLLSSSARRHCRWPKTGKPRGSSPTEIELTRAADDPATASHIRAPMALSFPDRSVFHAFFVHIPLMASRRSIPEV